ncbi:hypothetical protein ACSX1A_02260 [Pontibacter sp. MBLB2868]|uniref:hypothetical protein n=1 Tax=Pontibacter sp. MBLB2868 TaxID=3451555 RepID=UPI003F75225E
MILFENSIIKLDYNPATDILQIQYPDLHDYLLPEIKHSINIMVDIIRNYDIKKILLDSTLTHISVSAEESREISTYLAAGIMKTRVQKVARLQSPSTTVETTAQENIKHIKDVQTLPFLLKSFSSRPEAIEWLEASQDAIAEQSPES